MCLLTDVTGQSRRTVSLTSTGANGLDVCVWAPEAPPVTCARRWCWSGSHDVPRGSAATVGVNGDRWRPGGSHRSHGLRRGLSLAPQAPTDVSGPCGCSPVRHCRSQCAAQVLIAARARRRCSSPTVTARRRTSPSSWTSAPPSPWRRRRPPMSRGVDVVRAFVSVAVGGCARVHRASRPGALGPAGCALAETAFAVLYRSGVVVASIAVGRGGVFRGEERSGPCGSGNAKEDNGFDTPAVSQPPRGPERLPLPGVVARRRPSPSSAAAGW